MPEPVAICIRREGDGIRLTVELRQGGLTVLMPPAEFDRFLNLGASIFVGVAAHAHMAFDAAQPEPESSLQRHELN